MADGGRIKRNDRSVFLYEDPRPPVDLFAQCATCVFFADPGCPAIGDKYVRASDSCGLYCHGRPSSERPAKPFATPQEAGLVHRPVRCENCAYFEKPRRCGLFKRLNREQPAVFDLNDTVHPKGCCNAQTSRQKPQHRASGGPVGFAEGGSPDAPATADDEPLSTMAAIRQRYPMYSDMSDTALADAFHKKFYSDMPRDQFDAKMAAPAPPPLAPPRMKPAMAPAAPDSEPRAPIAGLPPGQRPMVPTRPDEEPGYFERIGQAFKEPLEEGASATQEYIDKYGPENPIAKAASLVGVRTLDAAFAHGPQAVMGAVSSALGLPPSAIADVLPGIVGAEGAPHTGTPRAPSPAKAALDNIAEGKPPGAPRETPAQTAPPAAAAGAPAMAAPPAAPEGAPAGPLPAATAARPVGAPPETPKATLDRIARGEPAAPPPAPAPVEPSRPGMWPEAPETAAAPAPEPDMAGRAAPPPPEADKPAPVAAPAQARAQLPKPRGAEPPTPKRPENLIEFLARSGGLENDEGGELRAMDAHKKFMLGKGMLVRKVGGMSLDEAREKAEEAGYLQPDSDINELLGAIDENLRGNHVFSDRDMTAADEWREHQEGMRRAPAGEEEVSGFAAGKFGSGAQITDRTDDYNRWLAERGGAADKDAAHNQARNYVTALGDETGHEHLVGLDAEGRVIGASTTGREESVHPTAELMARMHDPREQITAHHNHTIDTALSHDDIHMLALPGNDWVVAHRPAGDISAARLTPGADRALGFDTAARGRAISRIYSAGQETAFYLLEPEVRSGRLTLDRAGAIQSEAVNHALAATGVTDYVGSMGVPMDIPEPLLRTILERTFARVTQEARQHGISQDAGLGGLSRWPEPVRPEQGMAKVAGASAELPAGAAPRPPSPNGDKGSAEMARPRPGTRNGDGETPEKLSAGRETPPTPQRPLLPGEQGRLLEGMREGAEPSAHESFGEYAKRLWGDRWYVRDRPVRHEEERSAQRVKRSDYRAAEDAHKTAVAAAMARGERIPIKAWSSHRYEPEIAPHVPPNLRTADLRPLIADEEQRGRPSGPTVERTEQGMQRVLPGAERSAVQSAQSRESSGRGKLQPTKPQKAADEGLFGKKTLPQPKLPGFSAGRYQGRLPVSTPQRERQNGLIARSVLGKFFSPSTVSPGAEATAAMGREEIGVARRLTQQARARLQDFRDKTPLLGTPEGDALMAHLEGRSAGVKLDNPEHQPLADYIRAVNKNREAQLRQLPAGERMGFIQDYYRHMWKDPEKAEQTFSTTRGLAWQGSGKMLKQRTFPTYADGIAAGLEPLHPNIVEGEMAALANVDRFIAYERWKQRMVSNGTARWMEPEKAPAGWTQLQGRGTDAYGRSLFAPTDMARVYNNAVSRGIWSHEDLGPLYDKLLRAKNGMTMAELSASAFHAMTMTWESFASEFARGYQSLVAGHPIRAAGQMARSPVAVVPYLMKGRKGAAEYLEPGSQGHALAQQMDLLTRAGTSPPIGRGSQQFFTAQRGAYKSLTDFKRSMAEAAQDIKGHPLAGPFRQLTQQAARIIDTTSAPLFDYAIPRIKAGAAMNMLSDWLKDHPAAAFEDQLKAARDIVDSIDNRFGEMNYDNLMWHAGLKQAAFLSMRAFGWALGTWREIGGGVADVARGRLASNRAAYVVGLAATTALTNAALTYLHTGHAPQNATDLQAFDTGQTDEHGNAIRGMIPGYAKEASSLGANIKARGAGPALQSYAYSKLASLWQTAYELMTNRDYKDDPIGPPGAGLTTEKGREQMPEFLKRYFKEAITHYVPINWRQSLGVEDSRQTEGMTKTEQALAVRKAPFALSSPDAARRFFEKQASKPKGPEDKWKAKLKRENRATLEQP